MGVDFKQALGLTDDMTHSQKFQAIVDALGYEQVKRCIPFSIAIIKIALAEDEHLNNLDLYKWDVASGFTNPYRFSRGYKNIYTGSPLTRLYAKIGVTSFSNADGVCILKECARMWAEELMR